MEPSKFCEVAGFLLAARPDAAGVRSAVSRAYYALYHVVSQRLTARGFRLLVKRPECHESVYRILANSSNTQLQAIALSLNELRHSRNRADYDLDDRSIEALDSARVIVEDTSAAISSFDERCKDDAGMAGEWHAMEDFARKILRIDAPLR